MKNRRTVKLALAGLLLLLPLLLSGCYVTPEIENNNQGNNVSFPEYPSYTSVPTNNPATAAPTSATLPNTGTVNLPSSAPTVNTGSWLFTVAPLNSMVPINTGSSTVVTPPPTATPSPTPFTSLKLGSTGDDVRSLQRKLRELGFYKGSIDGDFGAGTETAVKAFQKQYGLTVDGKAGSNTLAKLASANATAKPTASPTPRKTATPRPTATPAFSQNTYLRKGNSGYNVRQMQERLIKLGYLSGTADGSFDVSTEAAVIAFQKRNCSYSDGVAGPETLKALYSSSARSTSTSSGIVGVTLRSGSEGAAVRTLQTKLKSLGFYTGTVDGSFGTGTEDAVKAFQRAHSLTADGVAGGGTFDKLFSTNAKTASSVAKTATPRPMATRKPTATPRKTPTPLPENVYVQVTPAPSGDYVTLRRGYYGTPVKEMQEALKKKGYYNGVADGYFGEGTENAVKAFQRVKGLTVDGVAGPATLRYLFEGDIPLGA
ncbi:MAG: hypothetical protein E7329_09545 [Clostridiales bacterium]|nr:hypothetical protein [Clostridiales bacterium]